MLREGGGTPGPVACPVGGRSRLAELRPPQRDARKSPLDCGSRREGLRESQPGSEWQRGKRRPPPPPPPLLLSRGRAAPPAQAGVREAARRPGQPRAHAAGGRPGTGLGARRGAGAPGARRRQFTSSDPPAPPSLPLSPSPRGFLGLKTIGDAELWSGIRPVDGAGSDQGERPGGRGQCRVAPRRSQASLGDMGRGWGWGWG